MTTYTGERPLNAETTINHLTREVNFSYPGKQKNNISYFQNNTSIFLPTLVLTFVFLGIHLQPYQDGSVVGFIYKLSIIILSLASSYILSGYINLFLCLSPRYRAYLPKIMATWTIKQKHIIDLSKQYGQRHILQGNKLYLMDYSIVYFQYFSTEPLQSFTTKSVDYEAKGDHMNFIAIFTFEKKPTKGQLLYIRGTI